MTASPSDFPEVLRECMYTHEIFRRLGIPAQDIYLAVTADSLGVTARQGLRQGSVRVGSRVGMTDAEIDARWDDLVQAWNAGDGTDWDFAGSTARRKSVEIMLGLISLSFEIVRPS